MVKMHLLFLTLFCLSCDLLADSLVTSIDRNPVVVNESFTLTITYNGQPDAAPDLNGLKQNFIIAGSSQYQNTNIVNGKTTKKYSWIVNLIPRQVGSFEIPALEIGSVKSEPITVKVLAASANTGQTGDQIDIELSVDKQEVYVGEQVLITMKLTRPYDAKERSITSDDPSFEFENLGKPREYSSLTNGIRMAHTDVQFVYFPEKEGSIKIPSVSYTVDVIEGRSRSAFSRRFSNYKTRVTRSAPIELKVKSKPAQVKSHWLPASALQIDSSWEPDTDTITAGDPLTWTLTLTARGLKHENLPDISMPDIAGLKWYPDKPQGENLIDNGYLGKKSFKFALVPSTKGELRLPRIEIPWWDTKENKEKTAVVPSKTLTVMASAARPQIINQPSESPATAQTDVKEVVKVIEREPGIWRALTFTFAAAWLITLIVFLWRFSSNRKSRQATAQFQENQRDLSWKKLIQICEKGQPHECQRALLQWYNGQHKQQPALSLADLAKSVSNSPLASSLLGLEQSLYRNEGSSWDSSLLLEHLKAARKELEQVKDTKIDAQPYTLKLNPSS